MSTAIKFENISKQYRLGLVSTRTLSHDLNRWWQMNIRGQEDPYLKIGEVNDRAHKGVSDYVWALKDINLEVKEGEVLGIIGKNGAGKSTLLKILSKVTTPTTGVIKAKGRIASLLEVGTGFHPEMTGRENIYMNGAILGMTKQEIGRKLDEIIDFAGIERYIDTPVKRYSSGMTVRLGFAVAAHLEPEILVVDEVLAVGDAEFQKKAIGKMQDISKGHGRTVLFVSHNMGSIQQLCKNGLVLKDGRTEFLGPVDEAVRYYLSDNNFDSLRNEFSIEPQAGKDFQLVHAIIKDDSNTAKSIFECDENIHIHFTFQNKQKIPGLYGYMQITNKNTGAAILVSDSNDIVLNSFDSMPTGNVQMKITIPKRTLGVGDYLIYLNFTSNFNLTDFNVDSPKEILSFSLVDNHSVRGNRRGGHFSTLLNWQIINS